MGWIKRAHAKRSHSCNGLLVGASASGVRRQILFMPVGAVSLRVGDHDKRRSRTALFVGDITFTGISLLEAGAVQTKGGKQRDAHTREVKECNGPRQSEALGFQVTK